MCRHIKIVLEGRPHKLLESVADRLATEILNDYHQVQGLQLHIKKPHVAVTGVVESLGKSAQLNDRGLIQLTHCIHANPDHASHCRH